PCTLLDFPTLDRFTQEIRNSDYDVIGISGIIPNIGKVRKMCENYQRAISPRATIVIGGHVANTPDIHNIVKADHIVRGDGIRWFRSFLGQNPEKPVKHPMMESAFGSRVMGHDLPNKPGDTAAILIPSVGCPVGCNFCSTSALFGGKGNFINFL
ncbi:MAG: B12-binding domain-containing radical SAM protein, partial [Desulfobacteraceae bacterium]|nr:B12-binding domain-containing radical SAM protein [Desulfobacteraceae bacterium]